MIKPKAAEELSKIESVSDQNLTRLLWAHGWKQPDDEGFMLLQHQYAAVRFVAGVSPSWPGKYPPSTYPAGSSNGGGILGDAMGLGKTIECLAGAWLREILHAHNEDSPAEYRTTLIVAPNQQVAEQWIAAAVRAGAPATVIGIYKTSTKTRPSILANALPAPRFVVCNISVLLSDCKGALSSFRAVDEEEGGSSFTYKPSPLAPHLSAVEAYRCFEKYLSDKAKKPDRQWVRGTDDAKVVADVIARDVAARAPNLPKRWLTVILDEAHFLRNPLSWTDVTPAADWGILAAAIGTHAGRLIMATGTPFNNNMGDLAALCSFYEVDTKRNKQATIKWWQETFDSSESGANPERKARLQEQLKSWRKEHWLRRTQSVLVGTRALPPCTERSVALPPSKSEINESGYARTEEFLQHVFHLFAQLLSQGTGGSPAQRFIRKRKLKALQDILIGLMQKLRMCMLHPLVANLGREVTRKFSPSRRHQTENDCMCCVVCLPTLSNAKAMKPGEDGECTCQEAGTCKYCQKYEKDDDEPQLDDGDECDCERLASAGELKEDEVCDYCQQEEAARGHNVDPAVVQQRRRRARGVGQRGEWASSMGHLLDKQFENGVTRRAVANPHPQLGRLVQIDRALCGAERGTKGNAHWAHERCLQMLTGGEAVKEEADKCPRCLLLRHLLHSGAGPPVCPKVSEVSAEASLETTAKPKTWGAALGAIEKQAEKKVSSRDEPPLTAPLSEQAPLMCVNLETAVDANGESYGGFRPSTKMIELRARIEEEPPADKILIFSMFKGFLDLAEAMITHEMGLRCCRFDGDVDQKKKSEALNQFKTDASVRVLLCTIHSGGVGLNIAEANVVYFCDRWFNPQVILQAICRAHRLGQTKPCRVTFLDAQDTFDTVVKQMMEAKLRNSEVILSDGESIGGQTGGGLSYEELSKTISRSVNKMIAARSGKADPVVFPAPSARGSAAAAAEARRGGSSEFKQDSDSAMAAAYSKREGKRPLSQPPERARQPHGPPTVVDLISDDDEEEATRKAKRPSLEKQDKQPSMATGSIPLGGDDDVVFSHERSRQQRDAIGRDNAINVDAHEDTESTLDCGLAQLVGMGFDAKVASKALRQTNGDVNLAAGLLLG